MDESKSFMYVLTNFDKTNTDITSYYYDINFGGFSELSNNYRAEVGSFAAVGGIAASQSYYLFVAENLVSDGYYCRNKLSNREALISKLPLNALQDAYIQSDGGKKKIVEFQNK
jgi:hypothetical protein